MNQIVCGEDCISAVIGWSYACVHPAVWELCRSYFYAVPCGLSGVPELDNFRDYTAAYERFIPLTSYDRKNLLTVYLYQLLVCDYYAQYYAADENRRQEFLIQARFAITVLKCYSERLA